MKTLRFLAVLGSFILIAAVPLVVGTIFYDSVEEPKTAIALWTAALLVCVWLTGCMAGVCRFWPKSTAVKAGAAFFAVMSLSGVWQGLPVHALKYSIFWAAAALLVLALDGIWNPDWLWKTGTADLSGSNGAEEAAPAGEKASNTAQQIPQTGENAQKTADNGGAEQNSSPAENAAAGTAGAEGLETKTGILESEGSTKPGPDASEKLDSGDSRQQRLWKLIGWLCLAGLLACAYSYLQRITPLDLHFCGIHIGDPLDWNNPHLSRERTIATFGNPNYFAVWAASLLPLGLSWLMSRTFAVWKKALGWTAWVMCAAAIMLTQTRAAWVGAAAGFAVWGAVMLFSSAGQERKKIFKTAAAALAALAVCAVIFASVQEHIGVKYGFAERLQSLRNLNDPSLQSRLFFWRSAINSTLAWPLTGAGPGGQTAAAMLDRALEPVDSRWTGRVPDTVHNQLLTVSSCAGFPGLIMLLISAALAFNSALHCKNSGLKAALAGSLAVFWTAHIFTSFVISTELLWAVLAVMAGISEAPEDEGCSKDAPSCRTCEDLLWDMGPGVRLCAFCSACLMLLASLGAAMDLYSLYSADQGVSLRLKAEALNEQKAGQSAVLTAYDDALACFEEASVFAPSWQQASYNAEIADTMYEVYAEVLDHNDYDVWMKAREFSDIAAAWAPGNPFMITRKAAVRANRPDIPGSLEEALHFQNMAICIDPRNPDLLYTKVRMLIDMKRAEEALRLLDVAEEIVPNQNMNLYYRVIALMTLGRNEEADRYAQKLLEQDPASAPALEALRRNTKQAQPDKVPSSLKRDGMEHKENTGKVPGKEGTAA